MYILTSASSQTLTRTFRQNLNKTTKDPLLHIFCEPYKKWRARVCTEQFVALDIIENLQWNRQSLKESSSKKLLIELYKPLQFIMQAKFSGSRHAGLRSKYIRTAINWQKLWNSQNLHDKCALCFREVFRYSILYKLNTCSSAAGFLCKPSSCSFCKIVKVFLNPKGQKASGTVPTKRRFPSMSFTSYEICTEKFGKSSMLLKSSIPQLFNHFLLLIRLR